MKITILYLFILFSILLWTDMILYYNWNMSYTGYYSDVIIFWLWLISSIWLIFLYWKKLAAKIYMFSLLILLIGSIVYLMIPFYALISSMSSLGLKLNKDLTNKYRVQIVGYSILTKPHLEIIENKGIVEKRILTCDNSDLENYSSSLKQPHGMDTIPDYINISDLKDVKYLSEDNNSITLALVNEAFTKTITFDKSTKSIRTTE